MALTARDAREVATAALERRDLSARAVSRRLLAAGTDPATAQETVDWLVSVGYVDDARLARARAAALAERGYGDAAIDARLEQQEIGREARETALAGLEFEASRARRVARKAAEGGPRRVVALLARRGFCDDAIEAALAALDD